MADARVIWTYSRRESAWYQVREAWECKGDVIHPGVLNGRSEAVQEMCKLRFGYRLLEEANAVSSQVPRLNYGPRVDLPLNSERPLLGVGRTEVRVDDGLC